MDVVPCSNNANDDVTTASYGWSQGITKHECNSQAHCDIIRGVCKTELQSQDITSIRAYQQRQVYVRLPCRYKTNDAMTTASYGWSQDCYVASKPTMPWQLQVTDGLKVTQTHELAAKSIVALQEVYVRLLCRFKTNDAMATASYGWSQ
ncbi:hypothetical protein J6590_106003, partial [Homalodisca vitripennis]